MQTIYELPGVDQGQAPAPPEENSTGRGFRASFFRSQFAPTVKTISFETPEQFARTLRAKTALTKAALPWIKLGLFTGEQTSNDCCRCDAFMTTLSGAECDYDAGEITALDAALWLQAAGVEAIVGETASSQPEAPRWRVWLPASREYTGTPDELRTIRQRWVARVNGIVNGTLDGSSFTLSQAFYIGGVKDRPQPTVIVTRGRRIDLCDDLDDGAIFKNGRAAPSERFQPLVLSGCIDESDDHPLLLAECRHRVANFTAHLGEGTTPTGTRVFQLVCWLGDISTPEGLTPSAAMIRDVIRDLYPETSVGHIEHMLARRQQPRGHFIINPTEDDLLDEDLSALDPVG